MCLIGVKETYVQEKKKVTKNFLGQICTTVSGLKDISPEKILNFLKEIFFKFEIVFSYVYVFTF